ncbi:caspase-1-like isoform X2 [Cimex lectularius]|uniref:Caspase n=1 Tax=Cimex lectularius TaxID=79782 RepID=A0A8I6SA60_CIMLE|nr:caspase-1-like isoform X2 [Cimex lectularius]
MESNFDESFTMDKTPFKAINIQKNVCDIRTSFEGSVHGGNYEFEDYHSRTVYSNSYDGDDEVFLETEETTETNVRIKREPRPRRISDVIDSIGDCSPLKDSHFTFPDFSEGTSDYSQNTFTTSRFQSPPVTPGSDVGYYSTGLSTPPSILNYKMMWSRTDTHVSDVQKTDELDGPNRDDTDAKVSGVYPNKVHNHAVSAKMPVRRDSCEYNMNHPHRGSAIIFNNENFKNSTMQPRKGSDIDVSKLNEMLNILGFQVTIHDDLGYNEIQSEIDKLVEQDFSQCDCLLVAVLTHGRINNYLHSKDHLYPVDMIWKPFSSDNCPTLAGKPKIFLIQACKGDQTDPGTQLISYNSTETDSSDSYTIPTMADFLIAYSTVEGYFSWRNPENGTWFIRSLCDVFIKNFETMDLLKMLTIVGRRVAIDFESYNDINPTYSGLKQVPSIFSTLIRDVYFRPKSNLC